MYQQLFVLNRYLTLSELSPNQFEQYKKSVRHAFPEIIHNSQVIIANWGKLEKYFPWSQLFLVDTNDHLIGFMNTIPLYWDNPLTDLPNDGWDWMLKKGIQDFENNIHPNSLGGLQIIVTQEYLGKGHSKEIIAQGKSLMQKRKFKQLIIPIRPTLKYTFPEMGMMEYMNLKKDNRIFDPWIRTHVNSGAQINHICSNSMNISGDLKFWEKLLKRKIKQSGTYSIDGGLNKVSIEVDKNHGEYSEDNIWISYT